MTHAWMPASPCGDSCLPAVDPEPDPVATGQATRRRELAAAADAAVRDSVPPALPAPQPAVSLVTSGAGA